jgi:hypothetical protein
VISYDQTRSRVQQAVPFADQIVEDLNSGGTTTTATLPGFSSSTTTLFDNSGFSSSFDQSRAGGEGDFSFGLTFVEFSVTELTTYTISGLLNSSDGYSHIDVALFDQTAGNLALFENFQSNIGAVSLSAGGTAGNFVNSLNGNLTGLLLPGRNYSWRVEFDSEAFPFADAGATVDGFALLNFSTSAIPEPASLYLLAVLASCLALFNWRRKTNACRRVA